MIRILPYLYLRFKLLNFCKKKKLTEPIVIKVWINMSTIYELHTNKTAYEYQTLKPKITNLIEFNKNNTNILR